MVWLTYESALPSIVIAKEASEYIKINKLEIFDLMGKKLLEIKKESINRVRLPRINSGVYIVKVQAPNTQYSKIVNLLK